MNKDYETFMVEDEHGRLLKATVITRMNIKGTNLKYLIYSIDDERDNRDVLDEEKQVIILAAKIEYDDKGNEILKNIESNEEKQAVYEAFNDSYDKAVIENGGLV